MNEVMDREKEIIKASEIFSEFEYNQIDFENGFYKGANWADQNPKKHWISVKDDLPCNHEEFIKTGGYYLKETIDFITIDEYDVIVNNLMVLYDNGKWQWKYGARPRYWMQIPELPKE